MENLEYLFDLINQQSKTLVGTLLKRIEVLESEEVLTPSLYKSLIKELVYENSRTLKKLIHIYYNVGKITFKSREK